MNIRTKKSTLFLIGILLILSIINFILLFQCVQFKKIASSETLLRHHAEWIINDGIRNVGKSIRLDSVPINRHLILRYNVTTCLPCLVEAEELLEEVFGRDFLMKELCGIGEIGQSNLSMDYLTIQSEKKITPMDDVYTPYFCVVNDNGDVLFTLSLIPDNYDYNREILIRLKKALEET